MIPLLFLLSAANTAASGEVAETRPPHREPEPGLPLPPEGSVLPSVVRRPSYPKSTLSAADQAARKRRNKAQKAARRINR